MIQEAFPSSTDPADGPDGADDRARTTAPSGHVSASRRSPVWPCWTLLALCLVGLGLSIDLARIHYLAHLSSAHRSFCDLSQGVSCDVVARSRWAVVAGVPIAWWGILGYSVMLVLSVLALVRRTRGPEVPVGMLGWSSLGASALVPYLAWVSLEKIRSVCVVCCGTYVISLSLAACSLYGCRRLGGIVRVLRAPLLWAAAERRRLALVGLLVVGLPTGFSLAFPRYWVRPELAGVSRDGMSTGVDEAGSPWIGSSHPTVTIVEFSDYQCPFCRRRHIEMRRLLSRYRRKIRLVHRAFPLDHHCNPRVHRRFHPHACRLAALAACAISQQKFWAANDYLFEHGRRPRPVGCKELAHAIGADEGALCRCMRSGAGERHVLDDIEKGLALGVRATPTFLLDGKMYPGRVDRVVLDRKLTRENGTGPAMIGAGRAVITRSR